MRFDGLVVQVRKKKIGNTDFQTKSDNKLMFNYKHNFKSFKQKYIEENIKTQYYFINCITTCELIKRLQKYNYLIAI